MRSGQALPYLVELVGVPVGNLTWILTNETGTNIASGTVVPVVGAISLTIPVTSGNNTLSGALWGSRDLTWSYTVGAELIYGEHRYSLEGRVPFGVTPGGVRTKLGLTADQDLVDDEIPLLKAYLLFQDRVGSVALTAVTGDIGKLIIREAIEASAALELLPTLQVRVAQRESSGTNQYVRGDVEWDKLEQVLRQLIAAGEVLVNPGLEPVSNGISLLQVASPSIDLFPGA